MLLTALHTEQPTRGYTSPAHPVQQAISRRMALFTGLPEADVQPVVSDGCGAPTFALPLKAIATAFQRFGAFLLLSGDCVMF